MHCVLGTRGAAASACIAAALAATLSSFLGRLRCLPFIESADATRRMRLCCWTLLSAHNAGSALCCRSFCVHGAPWPRFGGLHGSHARCAVTVVARGLLAGVLLGIGVQSGHRELEHGERDDPVSGMLFLRVGASMMCVGACACGCCLVRHALKLCAYPSACASAALGAASVRPATAAAWPMQACLARSANTRRAVCSRHCKRLGLGLARLRSHALCA
jgi:hypothetical protein